MTGHRVYTIQDQRRAHNHYRLGKSIRQTSRSTGIPAATLHGWFAASGILRTRSEGVQFLHTGDVWITPDAIERARQIIADGGGWADVGRALGIPPDRARMSLIKFGVRGINGSIASRRTWIDPAKPRAAAYLGRIASAVRMRADGRSYASIAASYGVNPQTVCNWAATPYGRALARFVHGPSCRWSEKIPHAHAMYHKQGLPAAFIAKVLDCDTATVEQWVTNAQPTPPKPKRPRKLSADQVRAIRAARRETDQSYRDIAHDFGVAPRLVHGICSGSFYADIPD